MEKISLLILFTSLCSVLGNYTYYSTYFGTALTSDEVAEYTSNSTLANCTILVQTCNSTEGRRINGTCNNLDHPSYGGTHTPYYRVLPADYHKISTTVFNPRLSKSGANLTYARKVRTTLWSEGRVADGKLASIINHLAVFFATDITNTRDTTNYVSWRTHCCKAAGKSDSACAANKVPHDDYVHRFSGIRCLIMTRPLTFQTSAQHNHAFEATLNLLLGINFVGIILFWNNHNFIADELAAINTCWTDEQLFEQAREINIAYGVQMFYYELMATLMGKDNLIKDGILLNGTGFRDVYNSSVLPQISLEYPVRWMHSLQDGDLRMYYTNGTYKSTFPIVDLTSNTNFLKENDTMDYVTQGFFRQPTGNSSDYIVDPDIVERGLSFLQRSNDIMTNDLAKNRYFGFQGYIYYIYYCFGDNITSFDNLTTFIEAERVEQLKQVYSYVEDIDLLAGIWAERPMSGSHVPPTFYCIVSKQLNTSMVSDRHFYERSGRPNAFTADQLAVVRNVTVARMLCDVGTGVTQIQPKAFELPTTSNAIVSCDKIPALNFTVWKDSTCDS